MNSVSTDLFSLELSTLGRLVATFVAIFIVLSQVIFISVGVVDFSGGRFSIVFVFPRLPSTLFILVVVVISV